MKKIFTPFLIFCFTVFSSTAFCQQPCVAQNKSLTAITEKQNISVSYFSENVATRPMYCLNFQNNGKTAITFSFTLKDKNGEVVSTESLTLAPGQSLNGMDNPSYNKSMIIPLADDQNPSDFSVELTF
jgi:archaellum component FlaF (FlaF/FlaG flagellin family)